MITIRNLSQELLDFDLVHDVVCRASGTCTCRVINRRATVYPPGKKVATGGVPQIRVTPVKVPKGVHLAPGDTFEGPDAVAELHAVKTMKDAGKIGIEIKVVGGVQP